MHPFDSLTFLHYTNDQDEEKASERQSNYKYTPHTYRKKIGGTRSAEADC